MQQSKRRALCGRPRAARLNSPPTEQAGQPRPDDRSSPSRTSSEPFELVPQRLIYGGGALGYHEGRAVLIRNALPCELVQAQAIRRAKGMLHARLIRVITPSPERVEAPCPHFGRCGGCHYQQLDATRQSAVKIEILRETLRRIGRIDWQGEVRLHTSNPWHYRNQAQLKMGPSHETESTAGNDSEITVGFFEADSHRLVSIDACPILSPRLNRILAEISRPEWKSRLAGFSEVEMFADDLDEEVMLTLRGPGNNLKPLAEYCLTSLPGVTTVAFGAVRPSPASKALGAPTKNRSGELNVFGKRHLRYRVKDCVYEVSPGSFFQASRFLLPELVMAATEDMGGALALDLYAGVGLFALPLARKFARVTAVEANPPAAADLRRNIESAGLGNARAVNAKTSEFLRRYSERSPNLVILDPPRAGADAETLRSLSRLSPDLIRYVSCQPPTFARDLAFLLRHGYEPRSIDLFDLFPQTFHIEAMATLARS